MKPSIFHSIAKEFTKLAGERLGDHLISLSLYGSVIRHEMGKFSDIDFFAIVSGKRAKGILYDIAFDLELKYGIPISLGIRTLQEARASKKAGSIYLKEVFETGRIIYGRNAI